MLQGALAALLVALIAGVLGYTGIDTSGAAVVFLLVAVFLVAAFIGAWKLRR
jgi:uncharacterized membrane protein YtjA (UPF0391 family)